MTRAAVLLLVALASASAGCAALTNPVADGVPVRRLPAEVLGRPQRTSSGSDGTRKGSGVTATRRAGANDVLRALNATGGPPGLDAKTEVVILRGQTDPTDPTPRVTRIPLRIYPDQPLTIREED